MTNSSVLQNTAALNASKRNSSIEISKDSTGIVGRFLEPAKHTVETNFEGTNGNFGAMFDVEAFQRNVIIHSIDFHSNIEDPNCGALIYMRKGSYVGHTNSPRGWKLLVNSTVICKGNAKRSHIPHKYFHHQNIVLKPRQRIGMYIHLSTPHLRYTNGTKRGSVIGVSEYLKILEGSGLSAFFGPPVEPRIWNGAINYNLAEEEETGKLETTRITGYDDDRILRDDETMPITTDVNSIDAETRQSTADYSAETCDVALATTFENNLGSYGTSYGTMFDIVTYKEIALYQLDVYTDVTTDVYFELYTKKNSFRDDDGKHDFSDWTHMKSGITRGRGLEAGTPIIGFDHLVIPSGMKQSFYVTLNTTSIRYQNISNEMPDAAVGTPYATNDDLEIQIGISIGQYPIRNLESGRGAWCGALHYVTNQPCSSTKPQSLPSLLTYLSPTYRPATEQSTTPSLELSMNLTVDSTADPTLGETLTSLKPIADSTTNGGAALGPIGSVSIPSTVIPSSSPFLSPYSTVTTTPTLNPTDTMAYEPTDLLQNPITSEMDFSLSATPSSKSSIESPTEEGESYSPLETGATIIPTNILEPHGLPNTQINTSIEFPAEEGADHSPLGTEATINHTNTNTPPDLPNTQVNTSSIASPSEEGTYPSPLGTGETTTSTNMNTPPGLSNTRVNTSSIMASSEEVADPYPLGTGETINSTNMNASLDLSNAPSEIKITASPSIAKVPTSMSSMEEAIPQLEPDPPKPSLVADISGTTLVPISTILESEAPFIPIFSLTPRGDMFNTQVPSQVPKIEPSQTPSSGSHEVRINEEHSETPSYTFSSFKQGESSWMPSYLHKTDYPSYGPEGCVKQAMLRTDFDAGSGAFGNMFTVKSKLQRIIITSLSFHTDFEGNVTAEVYTRPDDFVGFEDKPHEWRKLSQVTVAGSGEGIPTPIPEGRFEPVEMLPDTTLAFYVTLKSADIRYSKTNLSLGEVFIEDEYIAINAGAGVADYPFATNFFLYVPRLFNGMVQMQVPDENCLPREMIVFSFQILAPTAYTKQRILTLVSTRVTEVLHRLMNADEKLVEYQNQYQLSLERVVSMEKESCKSSTEFFRCFNIDAEATFEHSPDFQTGKFKFHILTYRVEVTLGVQLHFQTTYTGEVATSVAIRIALESKTSTERLNGEQLRSFEDGSTIFFKEKLKDSGLDVLAVDVEDQKAIQLARRSLFGRRLKGPLSYIAGKNVKDLLRDGVNGLVEIEATVMGHFKPPSDVAFGNLLDATISKADDFTITLQDHDEFFRVFRGVALEKVEENPLTTAAEVVEGIKSNDIGISVNPSPAHYRPFILLSVTGVIILVFSYCIFIHQKKKKNKDDLYHDVLSTVLNKKQEGGGFSEWFQTNAQSFQRKGQKNTQSFRRTSMLTHVREHLHSGRLSKADTHAENVRKGSGWFGSSKKKPKFDQSKPMVAFYGRKESLISAPTPEAVDNRTFHINDLEGAVQGNKGNSSKQDVDLLGLNEHVAVPASQFRRQ